MTTNLKNHLTTRVTEWQLRLHSAWQDETGGARNTDEGFHIGGGAIAAGVIATAVGAFVAKKMGALG